MKFVSCPSFCENYDKKNLIFSIQAPQILHFTVELSSVHILHPRQKVVPQSMLVMYIVANKNNYVRKRCAAKMRKLNIQNKKVN